eukprot:3183087-Prymnesium_polylepis.1
MIASSSADGADTSSRAGGSGGPASVAGSMTVCSLGLPSLSCVPRCLPSLDGASGSTGRPPASAALARHVAIASWEPQR